MPEFHVNPVPALLLNTVCTSLSAYCVILLSNWLVPEFHVNPVPALLLNTVCTLLSVYDVNGCPLLVKNPVKLISPFTSRL